jgi:Domain of unknown function (DUF6894)
MLADEAPGSAFHHQSWRDLMPRYFFHLRNNHRRLEDTEGTELADAQAAHQEAMNSAIELISDRLKGGWFQSGRKIFGSSIEVTDESGASVFTFPFAEVLTRG